MHLRPASRSRARSRLEEAVVDREVVAVQRTIELALRTKKSATSLVKDCTVPPIQASDFWSAADGNENMPSMFSVAARSMPAALEMVSTNGAESAL